MIAAYLTALDGARFLAVLAVLLSPLGGTCWPCGSPDAAHGAAVTPLDSIPAT